MPSKKNNAATDGILEILSFAGASVVLADADGIVKRVSGMHGYRRITSLDDVFEGLPPLPLSATDGEMELTLKPSGKKVSAMIVPAGGPEGLLAIIVRGDGAQESEHALSPVVYASDDIVFQFNASAEVYYVSGNVERITGYRGDEFLSGKVHPLDIIHPDDRPTLEKEFRNLFVTHTSTENTEHRIVKKNGEVSYMLKSWYALFDTSGKFTGIMGLNKDITAEKLLKERLELFHSAFEHSNDAIVITEVDGKIVDVNDAFTRIYGYSRDEAVGRTTAIIQSGHSTPEFYRQMWTSLERDGQWHGEILNRDKAGREKPIWLSITPIYIGQKKIGYMGIESDISERKNLEQQIIQTEKLATIGQLAAGIAHEIGTPLNIISGNAEFILLDMNETDSGYRELLTIIGQTKRMSQLMRQLLDFARPKVLSLQPTVVNDVLSDVLNFIRLQFKIGDIEIRPQFEEGISRVYGDPALLYQVFLNIVVNAYQAMSSGGTLDVRTRSEYTDDGREIVTIEIADTGEGIRPENLERIFTPFFTTKGPGKGTGLGLAVTKRIVNEHNGTIEIASEPGRGTTVTIRFSAFGRGK